jgi:hypothetical protein
MIATSQSIDRFGPPIDVRSHTDEPFAFTCSCLPSF